MTPKRKKSAKKTRKMPATALLSDSDKHEPAGPFLPASVVGMSFTADESCKDRNWFGYDSFTVAGDLGAFTVFSWENDSGHAYAFPPTVLLLATSHGVSKYVYVRRSEFINLMDVYNVVHTPAFKHVSR